jgi:hypothetical protein
VAVLDRPGGHRHRAQLPALVGEHLVEFGSLGDVAVPDVVEVAGADGQPAVPAGDGVHDDVGPGSRRVRHRVVQEGAGPGGDLRLRDRAPPPHVAGVARGHLGQQTTPAGRGDAVGEDDEVGVLDPSVGEAQGHRAVVLVDLGDMGVEVVGVGAEVVEERPVGRRP